MPLRTLLFASCFSMIPCPATSAPPAAPPITLEFQWHGFADPAGILNVENGITDGEASVFDCYGRLIITASKADARHPSKKHGKTAHLRLWDTEGNLIWDRPSHPDRKRQPRNGEDEIEIAVFSPDGRFVAAGGEDEKIEVWRVREDHHEAGEWLEVPQLVVTFRTGDGDQESDEAAIDSMTWSHDGRLLLAGTEEAGTVEVFRVQGDPAKWKRMHKARHGGKPGFAVNSLDLTEDDRYVGTAGTDTNAAFWRLDVTEDEDGLVTAVTMVKLATMKSLNGKAVDGSGREARFEPNGDRHFIYTLERTGLVQVYEVEELINYAGPPNSGPPPIAVLTNGDKIKDGNEIEPATYTSDGRFLIHDGDTRVDGSTEGIFPGYLRIVETKEISANAPSPDPVYVQRALATEYLDFSPDNTMLASGHGDGTVRLWKVIISGSETIASEAFNEPTKDAGRWSLIGPRSANAGKGRWGTSDAVTQTTPFRGHRGRHYLAAGNLGGETHALEITKSWDIDAHGDRGVQFAAAAAPGVFEVGDFLRLLADTDNDGEFEIVIAEFLPDGDGDLALDGEGGTKLNSVFLDDDGKTPFYSFEDYFVDLDKVLPGNLTGTIRFRVEARTDSNDEEIAFDSLRVTGKSPGSEATKPGADRP